MQRQLVSVCDVTVELAAGVEALRRLDLSVDDVGLSKKAAVRASANLPTIECAYFSAALKACSNVFENVAIEVAIVRRIDSRLVCHCSIAVEERREWRSSPERLHGSC